MAILMLIVLVMMISMGTFFQLPKETQRFWKVYYRLLHKRDSGDESLKDLSTEELKSLADKIASIEWWEGRI